MVLSIKHLNYNFLNAEPWLRLFNKKIIYLVIENLYLLLVKAKRVQQELTCYGK
jgi:hypothetical protein